VDLGILRFTDEVWTSDNTDPFDRLAMQDGFSYAYTPQIMMAWVTDSPHWGNGRATSLTYRMLSSMQGSLGIGANLNRWSAEDFFYGQAADCGVSLRATNDCPRRSLQADQPTRRQPIFLYETVSNNKDQAVVFAFAHSAQKGRGFPLLQVQGLDRTPCTSSVGSKARPGQELPERVRCVVMRHGLQLELRGDSPGSGVPAGSSAIIEGAWCSILFLEPVDTGTEMSTLKFSHALLQRDLHIGTVTGEA